MKSRMIGAAVVGLVVFSAAVGVQAQTAGAGMSLLAIQHGEGPDSADPTALPPGRAALTSLVIPGVGQIRQGRKWGWGLVAADLVLIGSAIWARSEGRDGQERYEAYAGQHWDRQQYLDYLDYYLAQTGAPWPHDHHTLPPPDVLNHDFYEMIGKYDQFAPGWDDWAAGTLEEGTSAHRSRYLDMRWRANRYLKWSLTAGGLIFLNHTFAALEAFVWGKRQQDRAATLRLRMSGTPGQGDRATLLTITWRLGR